MKKKNMHLGASRIIFKYAAKLRRDETPAEKKLWLYLKDRQMEGEKFRRQHPFKKFAGDFYCYKLRFIIEVDGEIHSTPVQIFYDKDRTEILEEKGLYILRLPNDVVMNEIELALDIIRHEIWRLRNKKGI